MLNGKEEAHSVIQLCRLFLEVVAGPCQSVSLLSGLGYILMFTSYDPQARTLLCW